MRIRLAIRLGLVLLVCCLAQGVVAGQDPLDIKKASSSKVGAVLSALSDEYLAHERSGDTTNFESENSSIRIVEGRVVIDAVASGETAVLRADLEALGLLKAASFGRMVSGELPLEAIADAAALESLQFARPAGAVTRRSGEPG